MSARAGYSIRRLGFGALIVAALSFVVYGLIWRAGAGEMRRAIETWADARRAEGLAVSYNRVATKGFPFSWRGAVDNVSIARAGAWRWRADALYIKTGPFAPKRLVFSTDNAQSVDLGRLGRWRIDAEDGRAAIEDLGAGAWRLEVVSGPGRVERIDGPVDGRAAINSARFRFTLAPNAADPGLTEASLSVDGLRITGTSKPIDAPLLAAEIAIRLPSDAEAALGDIILRRAALETAGASVSLAGALTLDAQGYPAGVLNAEIANPGALAALLGDLGALTREEAERAAASLTLAAIASGGKISGPLILKGGRASLAGVAIATLPRIDGID